eukprot:snap_masked-scaffold633_size121756-processed-gene-0.14 protein:Tk02265 transcript:snap_masked-scaffold633_size121756-processed-gene-0.14-mRNA-1 annotation:"probable 28s ribosomal protein mitochondrial precursor"
MSIARLGANSVSTIWHTPRLVGGTILVPRRHKGHLLPHRKPRWVLPAPSKKFKLPPTDHTPEPEIHLMNHLKVKYNEHYSAVTQYLHEDFMKYSDVGEVAKQEAEKEEIEHMDLLAQNQAANAQVAEARVQRKAEELERLKREAEEDLTQIQKQERNRLEALELRVASETESVKNAVTLANLEQKIEEALANPVDHEYAIDTEGHIYHGRYTECRDVPDNEKVKIAQPKDELDFLAD